MACDHSRPLNANNPNSLRLDVQAVGERAGVSNEGFNGINVRKGEKYLLSMAARANEGFAGTIDVSLEDADGKQLATTRFDGIGLDWKKLDAVLTSTESTPQARLVITTTAPGTIWLDMVSLFPAKTWKGRANGLRPDLAEMLVAMKPAFVRFPGGCFVEGDKLANATRWKQTIGDLSERPGHWNLWKYRSTDGLGYHEYLLLCEDLGAEPLFVINCGMAHEDNVPMDKLGPWIQDSLDAIEYANGPVDSKWGALRAKNGHPAPFNLKYLEIGNENYGPLYQERYRAFYDAIKAKWPDIHLVADEPTKERPTEITDDHYYNSPDFFIHNAGKYDSYDRKGPKIYVGEYAVTKECGQGNLQAAVAEAAFMTGLERNSDHVVMSSYAPLFVNVGWRVWNPNAIVFDNHRAYGTPSYYVQKMFAENRGDVLLPIDIPNDAKKSLYGVAGRAANGDVIVKVVNVAKEPQEATIRLADAPNIVASAEATVLTSGSPLDENSFAEPTKVVPVTTPIADTTNVISHTFPPHSVSVLRFKTAK